MTFSFFNTFYEGVASFVERLTGNSIDLVEIECQCSCDEAEEIAKKNQDAICAVLGDPLIGIIGRLEPDTIYCLKINDIGMNWYCELMEGVDEVLKEKNIIFIPFLDGMEFISVPEGYKLVKE